MVRQRLIEVGLEPDPVAVHDALAKPLLDGPATAVLGGGGPRFGAGEDAGERDEGVVTVAPAVVDEVEADLPSGGVDLVQRCDPAGVDDRRVKARGDALVEEHGVQHPPGRGGEPERDVRDTEHGVGARELPLDRTDRLDRLDAVAAALLHAGRERQRQGVEEEVLVGEPVAPDGEVTDRAGRGELPLGGTGLAVLVDAGADHGGAVLGGEGQERIEPRAGRIAILEVH